MTDKFERFNRYNPYTTIVADVDDASTDPNSDLNAPYDLIAWLLNTGESFGTPDDYIANHVLYVKNWYKAKKGVGVFNKAKVVNSYVKFLKEVLIVYENDEVKRYLTNIDWTDPYDLEIVTPFFAGRLREIILYVVKHREKMRFEKTKNSFRGSVIGTTKSIYDNIVNTITSERYTVKYGNRLPSARTLADDLKVSITEKYISSANQTNNPGGSETFEERLYLTGFDYSVFPDFDRAVLEVLKDFPIALASNGEALQDTGTTLIPSITADPDDISRLTIDYFENYTNSKSKLNILNHKKWIEKYSGTDTYYLSSKSGSDDYIFDKASTATYRTLNHLNIDHPSVCYTTGSDYKSLSQIGAYFTNPGVTHAYSLDLKYEINTDTLTGDNFSIIKDPSIYQVDNENVIQKEDISYMKANASSDNLQGDIIDAETFQKFYPYQSGDESNRYYKQGISRNTDNLDFWTGDFRNIWKNSDIYPVDLTYEYEEPTKKRIEDLLLGNRSVVNWRVDVFGNDYALLKQSLRPKIHKDPDTTSTNPCRVLDPQKYWNKVTWERPDYTDIADGGPRFNCYKLELYTDYAYGGYFKPYNCDDYVCYVPRYVEHERCPEPYVLSGHKATANPATLECWFTQYSRGPVKKGPPQPPMDLKAVYEEWPRFLESTGLSSADFWNDPSHASDPKKSYLQAGTAWRWDDVLQSPVQPLNTIFSAFIQPKQYWSLNYIHNAVLQSTNRDDDMIGLVAAVTDRSDIAPGMVDMIYVSRTRGGWENLQANNHSFYFSLMTVMVNQATAGNKVKKHREVRLNAKATHPSIPSYTEKGKMAEERRTNPPRWDDLPIPRVEDIKGGWSGQTSAVELERQGNIITARCSYIGPSDATTMDRHYLHPDTEIVLDLTSHPAYDAFVDTPTGYGYCNVSQADSFFLDSAAFKPVQPPPFKPVTFDIYDFTLCHEPRQWTYNKIANQWQRAGGGFDGVNIMVVDKDGCGSYGIDCLGRCHFTPPISGDCCETTAISSVSASPLTGSSLTGALTS